MGNFPSQQLDSDDLRQLQGNSGLSQYQIQRLYSRFMDLDRRRCGALCPSDLLRIPELAMNPLRKRLIIAILAERQITGDASSFIEQGDDINFRQFLNICSIFIVPKYKEVLDVEQRLAHRKRKFRFLHRVIDNYGNGCIRRCDLLETLLLVRQRRPADVSPLELPGGCLRNGTSTSGDAATLRDELNEIFTALFGTKEQLSYEAFDTLLQDIDIERLMGIEMWHNTTLAGSSAETSQE